MSDPGLLGAATGYAVHFMHRGGGRLYWAPDPRGVTKLAWERRVDDTAQHTVEIAKGTLPRGELAALGGLRTWAHEVAVWRLLPAPAAAQLAAAGPLVDYAEVQGTVTLTCADVTAWLDHRLVHNDHVYTKDDPGDAALMGGAIVRDGLGPDDPQLLERLYVQPAGVQLVRSTLAYSGTCGDELRALAALGMDFTVDGRAIVISGELAGQYPPVATLTETHFRADLTINEAGAEATTRQWVAGATDTDTNTTPLAYAGGIDTDLGLLEALTTNDKITEAVTARRAAQVALASSYPAPVYLRVPDGAQLDPRAPVTLGQLVPGTGVRVGINGGGYARPVTTLMRLVRVNGAWDAQAGEQIGVNLAPWAAVAADDADFTTDPADVADDPGDSDPGDDTDVIPNPGDVPAISGDNTGNDPDPTLPPGADVDDKDPASTQRIICWAEPLPAEPAITRIRRWMTVTGDIP